MKFVSLNIQNYSEFVHFIYENILDNYYIDELVKTNFSKIVDFLDIKNSTSFIVKKENVPIGMFLGGIRGIGGYIPLLVINKEYRKRGLGRIVLQKGLSAFADFNCSSVRLEVFKENDAALKLYLSEGFDIVKEIYTLKNENNSFYYKNFKRDIQIEKSSSFTFQPLYRSFNKNKKKPWTQGLRSIIKIIENYEGELYIIKERNKIIGYIVITRDTGCLQINDIYLQYQDVDLFSYILTHILRQEKVVIGKFLYEDSPIVKLFRHTGFYTDKIQYEMQRKL